jgi:hypothetical protein
VWRRVVCNVELAPPRRLRDGLGLVTMCFNDCIHRLVGLHVVLHLCDGGVCARVCVCVYM